MMEQKNNAKPAAGFMESLIGGKTLKEYFSIIKSPLLILIAMDAANFLAGFLVYLPVYGLGMLSVLIGMAVFVLSLGVGSFIGYSMIKEHSGNLYNALAAGTIAGVINGSISWILSILSIFAGIQLGYYFSTSIWDMIAIGLFISLLSGIIIGGIVAVIGGLIAGSRTFNAPAAKK